MPKRALFRARTDLRAKKSARKEHASPPAPKRPAPSDSESTIPEEPELPTLPITEDDVVEGVLENPDLGRLSLHPVPVPTGKNGTDVPAGLKQLEDGQWIATKFSKWYPWKGENYKQVSKPGTREAAEKWLEGEETKLKRYQREVEEEYRELESIELLSKDSIQTLDGVKLVMKQVEQSKKVLTLEFLNETKTKAGFMAAIQAAREERIKRRAKSKVRGTEKQSAVWEAGAEARAAAKAAAPPRPEKQTGARTRVKRVGTRYELFERGIRRNKDSGKYSAWIRVTEDGTRKTKYGTDTTLEEARRQRAEHDEEMEEYKRDPKKVEERVERAKHTLEAEDAFRDWIWPRLAKRGYEMEVMPEFRRADVLVKHKSWAPDEYVRIQLKTRGSQQNGNVQFGSTFGYGADVGEDGTVVSVPEHAMLVLCGVERFGMEGYDMWCLDGRRVNAKSLIVSRTDGTLTENSVRALGDDNAPIVPVSMEGLILMIDDKAKDPLFTTTVDKAVLDVANPNQRKEMLLMLCLSQVKDLNLKLPKGSQKAWDFTFGLKNERLRAQFKSYSADRKGISLQHGNDGRPYGVGDGIDYFFFAFLWRHESKYYLFWNKIGWKKMQTEKLVRDEQGMGGKKMTTVRLCSTPEIRNAERWQEIIWKKVQEQWNSSNKWMPEFKHVQLIEPRGELTEALLNEACDQMCADCWEEESEEEEEDAPAPRGNPFG